MLGRDRPWPRMQVSEIGLTPEGTREPLKILEQENNIPSRELDLLDWGKG